MSNPLGPIRTEMKSLREFVERELGEHDDEIEKLREDNEKRFGVVERRVSKLGQALRDLRKVVSLIRRTVADLAGRPVE